MTENKLQEFLYDNLFQWGELAIGHDGDARDGIAREVLDRQDLAVQDRDVIIAAVEIQDRVALDPQERPGAILLLLFEEAADGHHGPESLEVIGQDLALDEDERTEPGDDKSECLHAFRRHAVEPRLAPPIEHGAREPSIRQGLPQAVPEDWLHPVLARPVMGAGVPADLEKALAVRHLATPPDHKALHGSVFL